MALEHSYTIGSTADLEFNAFTALLAAAVQSDEETMVAGDNGEANDGIVGKRKRAGSERVRRHRHQTQRTAAGLHDGAADRQSIACGARRRVYNQAVGLIGREILAIDAHTHADHRRHFLFQNSHFVEREGIALRHISTLCRLRGADAAFV